jgi:hypothetical protein
VSYLSPAIYTFWVASNGPNADIEPHTTLLHSEFKPVLL